MWGVNVMETVVIIYRSKELEIVAHCSPLHRIMAAMSKAT